MSAPSPAPQHVFGLPVSPATMYLWVREGSPLSAVFPLEKAITRIGRSGAHADVVLADNPRISRRHATVIRLPHPRGAHYIIIDEGSTNGIYVNEQRVEVRCLNPCDVIRLSDTTLEFLPEELLPKQDEHVALEPLHVDTDVDRSDLRKPGEAP